MTSPDPRPLGLEDLRSAAEVLTNALHDDPLFEVMLPDPTSRRPALRRQMSGALRFALRYGIVEVTEDLGGVAVWLPPGRSQVTAPAILRAGPAAVWELMYLPPSAVRRANATRKPMATLHHASAPDPHWYLWILGVDPSRQRLGMGQMLVRHRLAEIDGTPVYLETTRAENVGFYERLGFEVAGVAGVAKLDLTYWGMVLPARNSTLAE